MYVLCQKGQQPSCEEDGQHFNDQSMHSGEQSPSCLQRLLVLNDLQTGVNSLMQGIVSTKIKLEESNRGKMP